MPSKIVVKHLAELRADEKPGTVTVSCQESRGIHLLHVVSCDVCFHLHLPAVNETGGASSAFFSHQGQIIRVKQVIRLKQIIGLNRLSERTCYETMGC